MKRSKYFVMLTSTSPDSQLLNKSETNPWVGLPVIEAGESRTLTKLKVRAKNKKRPRSKEACLLDKEKSLSPKFFFLFIEH